MSRKIIDYIVVEVTKVRREEHLYYYPAYREEGLKIALKIKNSGEGIIIKENKKRLLEEEIIYIDTLLQTVEDFSTCKVSVYEIIIYKNKYDNPHPLEYLCKLSEGHEEKLFENIKTLQEEIVIVDKEIAAAKIRVQKLKIEENTILENNQNLDFETFRTDFEKSVIYYLEKGYELKGGVSISKKDPYDLLYCQAMVKYED